MRVSRTRLIGRPRLPLSSPRPFGERPFARARVGAAPTQKACVPQRAHTPTLSYRHRLVRDRPERERESLLLVSRFGRRRRSTRGGGGAVDPAVAVHEHPRRLARSPRRVDEAPHSTVAPHSERVRRVARVDAAVRHRVRVGSRRTPLLRAKKCVCFSFLLSCFLLVPAFFFVFLLLGALDTRRSVYARAHAPWTTTETHQGSDKLTTCVIPSSFECIT